MQTLLYVFWASVVLALAAAFWDCARRPESAASAWKRFRPVAAVVAVIAAVFLVANLAQTRLTRTNILIPQALRLAGVAVLASIFFCGGWSWASRPGRIRLLAQRGKPSGDWKSPDTQRLSREVFLLSAVAVGFSVALLQITGAKPAPGLEKWVSSQDGWHLRSGYLFLLIALVPLWEEAAFRWYILNRLEVILIDRPWGRAAAVALSSAFWAFGHAGVADPAWVKFLQIFAIGCLLGWRFRVIGLTGCIIVHLAVNLSALLIQSPLP